MLSQVRRPEISLSKRLGELITLCKESIEVCALVREFLDESCDDSLEWHREVVVSGNASDSLLGLAAARASQPVRTFGRDEWHGEPRDAGNIAVGSGPRKEASAACPERPLNSARFAPFTRWMYSFAIFTTCSRAFAGGSRHGHAFADGSVPTKAAQTGVRACMRYSRISRNETSRPRLSSQSTNRTHLRLSMSVSLPVAASSG